MIIMNNILTNGCELTTAITNIFIAISSLICFLKLKSKKKTNLNVKLWLIFFFFILIDGILGVIIHGIVMKQTTVDFLWYILSFFFSLTINTLLAITLYEYNNKGTFKSKVIFILLTSILLYLVFFIESLCNIDFLLTFIIYAAICLGAICIIYIKQLKKDKHIKYYIYGLLLQVIGGIFLLNDKFKIHFIISLDKNGIYHLFMVGTIIMYYIGIINNNKLESK